MSRHWTFHPAVKSGDELSLGERCADRLRNGMGSWTFIFGALTFLGGWITSALEGLPIDNKQLTILNLILSCLAALQGGILLIAAKRSDAISAQLAKHDFETDQRTEAKVDRIQAELDELRAAGSA